MVDLCYCDGLRYCSCCIEEEDDSDEDVEEGKEVIQYEWNKDDSHTPAPYAL